MDDALLRLTLVLSYGPFCLMLGIFLLAGLLKLGGRPDLLTWLVAKTSAQQPGPKPNSGKAGKSVPGEH
jgi:hypothetical protein